MSTWILILIILLFLLGLLGFILISIGDKEQKEIESFCELCVKNRLGEEKKENKTNYRLAKKSDLIILHVLLDELKEIELHAPKILRGKRVRKNNKKRNEILNRAQHNIKNQKEKIAKHISTLLFIKLVQEDGRSNRDPDFHYPSELKEGDFPIVKSHHWSSVSDSYGCGKGLHFTTIDQFNLFSHYGSDLIVAQLILNPNQNLEESIEIVCAHNDQKVRAHAIQMICYIPNFEHEASSRKIN